MLIKKRFIFGKYFAYLLVLIVMLGFLIPEPKIIPVESASAKDWNQKSFWFYPWGKSVVHKGIDIFGKKGTQLLASTNLLILYTGEIKQGGKIVLALGPKWRLHYYAHLDSITTKPVSFVKAGAAIGTLGDSGNAKGKPPHLHFTIVSLLPYFWEIDDSIMGWKKAFFLDPGQYLLN